MPTSSDWFKPTPSRIHLFSLALSILVHLALLYGFYWFATVPTLQQDSSKPFPVILQATLAQLPVSKQKEQAQSQISASNSAKTKQTQTKPSAASTSAASKPKPKTIAQTQEPTRAEVPLKNPTQTAKATSAKSAPNRSLEPNSAISSGSQASNDTKKIKLSPDTDTKAATTKTTPSKTATSTSPTNTLQATKEPNTSTTLRDPVCSGPKPTYPRLSRLRREAGQVRILIWVAPDNSAIQKLDVLQSSGFARLDQAALVAVRRWRCQAAELAGKPHKGAIEQSFDFDLLN